MIVVISGASGSGKTTLAKCVLQVFPGARMLESYTTRSSRESDTPGEYVYVTKLKFFILWLLGFFLWKIKIHGIDYGTAERSILIAANQKRSVALMILSPDVLEKLNIFAQNNDIDIMYCHILSPGQEVIIKRLRERGDKEEDIQRRVQDCLDWDKKVYAMTDISVMFLCNNKDITEPANRVISQIIERVRSN